MEAYAIFVKNKSSCLDCNLTFETACAMIKHFRENPGHKPYNLACRECEQEYMILWKEGYCKTCWDKNHVQIKFSNGKLFVVTKEGEEVLTKIAKKYCIEEVDKIGQEK